MVGGGAAGIRTAALLEAAGLDVILLEARDRLGGRVLSIPCGEGMAVEAGAQFVAKSGQTRLKQLAKNSNSSLVSRSLKGVSLQKEGADYVRLPMHEPKLSLLDSLDLLRLNGIIQREIRSLAKGTGDRNRRLADVSALEWLQRTSWLPGSFRVVENALEQAACVDPSKISILAALSTLSTIGGLEMLDDADHYSCPTGLQGVLLHEAKDAGFEVRLQSPVNQVTVTPSCVRLDASGGEVLASKVVLALPPHLYRHIRFDPALPEQVAEKLNNYVEGHVVKVVSVYDQSFWRSRGFTGTVFSPEEGFDLLVDTSDGYGGKGVLVGLVGGRRADALLAQPVEWRKRFHHDQAQAAFGELPIPIQQESVDWLAERWSEGGYSASPSLRSAHDGGEFGPIGPLFFAGTETADEWRGYIEGALQSAEREAAKIIAAGRRSSAR